MQHMEERVALIDLGTASDETKGLPIVGEPDTNQGAKFVGIADD